MGYIYILGSSKSALHKIGYSEDPHIRISNLSTRISDIKPVRIFFGTMADERALHEKFCKKRVTGEWFKLTGRDIDLISKHFSDHEQQALMLSMMCARIIQVNIENYKPEQYRPTRSLLKVSEHVELTTCESKKIARYKISENTAKIVKSIISQNEDTTVRDVCMKIGCSVSLAEKALSCFRSQS